MRAPSCGINDGERIPVSYTGKLALSLCSGSPPKCGRFTNIPCRRRLGARLADALLAGAHPRLRAPGLAPQAPGATGLSHRAGPVRHGVLPALTPRVSRRPSHGRARCPCRVSTAAAGDLGREHPRPHRSGCSGGRCTRSTRPGEHAPTPASPQQATASPRLWRAARCSGLCSCDPCMRGCAATGYRPTERLQTHA